jgi:hypothetical protein
MNIFLTIFLFAIILACGVGCIAVGAYTCISSIKERKIIDDTFFSLFMFFMGLTVGLCGLVLSASLVLFFI